MILFGAGKLVKQQNGRWAIGSDEMTSGDCVQVRVKRGPMAMWLHGRIEHGEGGYYFLWVDVEGGPGERFELVQGALARRKP